MRKSIPPFLRRLPLALMIVGLVIGAAGCQSGQIKNNVVSPSQENDEGREYASEIDSQVKFVLDGKVNRHVLDVATPVLAEAQKDRPDVSFRVRVIESPGTERFFHPWRIHLYLSRFAGQDWKR